MTTHSRPPKTRHPILSQEDDELWRHTTRSLKPLKKAKPHVMTAGEAQRAEAPAQSAARKAGEAKVRAVAPVSVPRPASPAAARSSKVEIGAVDARNARKLARGRLEIEARIDLHGMYQAEAHAELHRFLKRAHASGKRWVLVITGKGSTSALHGPNEAWPDGRERGVLKRSVPIWLAEPGIRELIVSISEASPSHGGSGALYIHLRKRDRTPT